MIEEKLTDENGRVKDFLKEDGTEHDGVYKLIYHVKTYFDLMGEDTFYPFVEVAFEIKGKNIIMCLSLYHLTVILPTEGTDL